MTGNQDADERVKATLLAMLHDKNGLAGIGGGLDYVAWGWDVHEAQSARWDHLEDCAEAYVIGPVSCTQEATSTGTGFEILTAPITCPHGDPMTGKTAAYGIGSLLAKMLEASADV